jgi:hypothetical protein
MKKALYLKNIPALICLIPPPFSSSSSSSSSSSNNNNGILQLNVEHYKYLRALLPTIPHLIDSLCVSDVNSWECSVYAALLSESDCVKWLIEFQVK